MKNIIGTIFVSLIFHTLLLADYSLTGLTAERLYHLIPSAPIAEVFRVSMNMKVLGANYACSQKVIVSDADGRENYEYYCVLPDKSSDGNINLLNDLARPIFDGMRSHKKTKESVQTSTNVATYVRTFDAISCHQRNFLGGKVEYRCMITP